MRIAIIVLIYAGVCGGAWYLAGPDDRWDVLTSISTALAVIIALFSGEIQKLVYRATVSVYVADHLIDPAHNLLWIRGKVMNSGDRAVQRCRIKVLRIEGQPSQIENGYLEWQGGSQELVTLGSQEHLIFNIATRPPAQGSLVEVFSFITGNKLTHLLNPGQT
ncbi:MAG: hypothetical protein DMF26_04965 [Verrucomicrobia bacterium]|nr:MAG: hypothetical protein DMF26_04965 [Verrucomicrobiota bacterium]